MILYPSNQRRRGTHSCAHLEEQLRAQQDDRLFRAQQMAQAQSESNRFQTSAAWAALGS